MRAPGALLGVALSLLSVSCGLAAPRIVDDPPGGSALRLVEEKNPIQMEFSRSGDLLLIFSSASGHDDGYAVRVFDLPSMRLLWSAPGTHPSFDPDGRRVVLRLDGRFELREARSGRVLRRLERAEGQTVAFVGSRLLGVGGEGGLVLRDAESDRTVDRFSHRGSLVAGRGAADGKRLVVGLEAGGVTPLSQVLDYPGFVPRCAAPTGELAPDGSTLVITTSSYDAVLVDASTCAPLVRTCPLEGGPSVDGKVWFWDQWFGPRMRVVAFHLPSLSWQVGPELSPPPTRLAAGPSSLVLHRSSVKEDDYAHYFYLRPLSSWLSRPVAAAPERPRPYHWLVCPGWTNQRGDEPPGPISGVVVEDRRVALRLLPGRAEDLVLQLTNRDTKPLRIDWERSSLSVAAGSPPTARRLWLGHLGCPRYDARLGETPCLPTEVLPGSGYVDVLHARARPDDPQRAELVARCGDRFALELVVSSPGEPARTLRPELRYCPDQVR